MTFPKDAQHKLTLKQLEIYDQFDGRNKDDLARRYGVAPRGTRTLLQRIREKIKAQNADAEGQLTMIDYTR